MVQSLFFILQLHGTDHNTLANGLARSQNHTKLTNAIAESLDNQLKTIIKSAYGYHNFERFRKRALLIITYGKPR
ncbi:MAG: transposase [Erysipelotrichaceae bacterium]|nr:transposase [Erysipelotrichaceae bacterium]